MLNWIVSASHMSLPDYSSCVVEHSHLDIGKAQGGLNITECILNLGWGADVLQETALMSI